MSQLEVVSVETFPMMRNLAGEPTHYEVTVTSKAIYVTPAEAQEMLKDFIPTSKIKVTIVPVGAN